MLTQAEVKKSFSYDENTGEFVWIKRTSNRTKNGQLSGYINNKGYRVTRFNRKNYNTHRLIWLWYYGYFPENMVDHINQNKLDNRIINLREISNSCNLQNSGNFSHNTSGVKGVSFDKKRDKWCVYIRDNKTTYRVGRFKCFEEAVSHRLAFEQCLGWDSCYSTSPAYLFIRRLYGK